MSNAIYSRPAPHRDLWPRLTHPVVQQLSLLRSLSSSPLSWHWYRCTGHAVHQLKVACSCRGSRVSACSVGYNPTRPRGENDRNDCASGTGRLRTAWPSDPVSSGVPWPPPSPSPRTPASPSPHFHSLLEAAARSTAAILLTTSLVLSATLGLPADAAPPAAAVTAAPPPSTAVLGPLPQQQPIPTPPAVALGNAGVATQSSITAPPDALVAPAIRFTSPEVLEALPPLPTEFPPLPELQLPSYTTAKLRNGLRVFLLRDEEVSLVRATLLMRGGQYGSQPDKVGVATLTAYVQRAGGSEAHPAPYLDSRLEELAASIEMGAGPQAVSADMQCLAEDVEEVMSLMAEVIRTPALPGDKLALYQAQILNALEHQNDSPAAIGRRKITKLLYGPDSIYARTPTKAGVSSISPDDLRAYVVRWERPDAAVLGVVGAFEPRKMLALVEREFGDWAPAPGQPDEPPAVPRGSPPAVPTLNPAPAAVAAATTAASARPESFPSSTSFTAASSTSLAEGSEGSEGAAPAAPPPAATATPSGRRPAVYLVDRPGLTQAYVLTAEPGISLSDPDLFALDVLGGIFNSFGGQLFDTLRSREGLAYSVSGGWDSPADHQGLFVAGGQTSSPGEFLRSLRQLLSRAAAEAPSVQELEAAKAETLNSFVFNFASTASQLQRILVYDLLGLPQNFLFKYIQGIEGVELQGVARAAAVHLHPEQQAVVVVGDREVAQPRMEAAGFEVLSMRLDD